MRYSINPFIHIKLLTDHFRLFESLELFPKLSLRQDTPLKIFICVPHIFNKINRKYYTFFRYTDEAPLDDENDQLLYIRERVAFKFQEANGWIDIESQQSSREELVAKTKRIVDLSAPKFKTSDDRYKEFSQQRRLDIQKFGLSSFMGDTRENNEKKKDENRIRSSKHENEKDRKISTFTVQAGPSVNIKGELITQNLENIHISPDSSFVQENPNVGTYMICHDFCKKNEFSPRKKEKVVRISDDNSGNSKNSMRSTNGKSKKGSSKDGDEIGNGAEISEKLERTDIISKECSGVFVENNEKLIENKTEESLMKNLEKKENLESTMNLKLTQSNDKSIQKISNLKSENEIVEEEADNSKISFKNDQKQIRFDEQISKPRNREKEKEICSNLKQDSTRILEDNNEKFKYSLSLADSKINDDELPLPSNIIEEIYKINKKRHKEICEKRKTEKEEERYKEIDKRFSNIVKKYCDKDEKLVEKSQIDKENSDHILSLSIISSEDSEESDELYTLYEPPVEELDGVLSSYNKIIDNIVQSTKTIDKFLSRPELEEYQIDDTTTIKTSKKVIDPVSLSKEKIYKKRKCSAESRTKQSTVSKIKNSIIKDRLPGANKNISKEWDVNKMKRVKSTIFTKKDHDSKKKYAAPKISNKFPTRLNSLMKDRLSVWKKFPQEETSESNEDISKDGKTIGINASKQIPRHKTRLFRIVNDSSNLTASSNYPQSSSIDTKNGNDTRITEEISKSLINDEIREKTTILKINSLKDDDKDDEVEKGNFETLQNIVYSDILKQVVPKARCSRNLIARVLHEETRLIEDKIKNIFNVNEIVPLILKNLKSDETNFENLKLLNVEDSNNVGSNEIQIAQIVEETESNDEKMRCEKQDLQLEHLPSEGNFSAVETIKYCGEIREMRENILNKSDGKNSILIESIPNSEDELKCNQSISQSKNENIRDEEVDKINFNIDLKKNAETDNINNISKRNNENIISKDIDIQRKEINNENLISTKIVSNIVDESNENKKYNAMYINEKINLRNEDTNLDGINKISLIINDEKTENVKHNDFEISDKSPDLKKEKFVELHSIKDTEKNDKQFDNNFSQVSSSNSLHNCISLRSSSKNLSKTSSNNPEFSQNMNEFRHITESSVAIDDKIRNNFSYNLLEKKRILSNVYDDLDKKFCSTYIDTNYSNLFNQEYR